MDFKVKDRKHPFFPDLKTAGGEWLRIAYPPEEWSLRLFWSKRVPTGKRWVLGLCSFETCTYMSFVHVTPPDPH